MGGPRFFRPPMSLEFLPRAHAEREDDRGELGLRPPRERCTNISARDDENGAREHRDRHADGQHDSIAALHEGNTRLEAAFARWMRAWTGGAPHSRWCTAKG